MSSPIVISGIGQVSAVGVGKSFLWKAMAGSGEILLHKKSISTKAGDVEIPLYLAPEVTLPSDIPESIKRRMPRISKMALVSSIEAVTDAFGIGYPVIQQNPARVGIVVGTAFGCLELALSYERRLLTEGPTGASPTMFASSVQNAIAAQLSIMLGTQGPTSTVTTMEQTTVSAFRLGYDWLQQGLVDHVLITVGDELTPFHFYALAQTGSAVSTKLNPKTDACTAIGGEGMASFVLSRADSLDIQKKYCTISDIQLFSTSCPPTPRYVAAAYGGKNQWAKYTEWTKANPLCHSQHFGSFVTGCAFEIAVTAHLVRQDQIPTLCLQITDRNEVQSLTLHP